MATNTLEMTSLNPARARALVFPREHGAWGILLVPLVSGAVVGALGSGFHLPPLLFFLTAALALFLLRTPVESLLGTTPFRIRGVTLKNRVVVSPMAQYSCVDGMPADYHLVHLGARAMGGAAMVVAEMTCPTPDARITPGCPGLWSEAQVLTSFPSTSKVPLIP